MVFSFHISLWSCSIGRDGRAVEAEDYLFPIFLYHRASSSLHLKSS